MGKRAPGRIKAVAGVLMLVALLLVDLSIPVSGLKMAFVFALFSDWWMLLVWAVLVDGFFSRLGPGLTVALIALLTEQLGKRIFGPSSNLPRLIAWAVAIEVAGLLGQASSMVSGYGLLILYLFISAGMKWIGQRR